MSGSLFEVAVISSNQVSVPLRAAIPGSRSCCGRSAIWLCVPGRFRLTAICLALCAVIGVSSASRAQTPSPSQTSRSMRQVQGFTPAPLDSGFSPLDASRPVGISSAEIIRRFASKESQFKQALENYTYRRTVKVDTIDDDGSVDGEYLQVDDIVFSSTGRKRELVVYAPNNTLKRIAMSPADYDDIEHRLPFTLTAEDIGQYRLNYIGKQNVDQVATYVFDVAPKQMENGRRYFSGRIWVDAHDYQIVVTNGKNIPDDTRPNQEDLSVPFTTYRQQVDGKYWFPVYTRADGVLHFTNCKECLPEDDHIREIVKYGEYKRFGSDVHMIYDGVDIAEKTQPAPNSGSPQTASYSSGGSQPQSATKE